MWDIGDAFIKGCSLGVLASISSEAVTGSFSAARCLVSAVHGFGSDWHRARWPQDEAGIMASISKWRLRKDMQLLLEMAMTEPQLLLSGRAAWALKRLLHNLHRLTSATGDLPWQLVLIQQRIETVIDRLSYDDLCAFFGAGNPPPAACSEAGARQLLKHRKFRPSQRQCYTGVGAGEHRACPICMQNFSPRASVVELPHCRHAYHPSCVTKWLQLRGDCPVCRHVVNDECCAEQ